MPERARTAATGPRRTWTREYDRLDRDQIDAIQLAGLRDYVDVLNTNQYWRARLNGLTSDDFNSVADIRRLPFESKVDVIADISARPPFGMRPCIEPADLREVHTSSGTSGGQREAFGYNASELEFANLPYAEAFTWAGWGPGMRIALPLPVGMTGAGITGPRVCDVIGAVALRIGPESTSARIDTMLEYDVQGLFTTGAYLDALRFELESRDLRPPKRMESMILAGLRSPEWVVSQRNFWNCRIHELYGSAQVGGALSATCEAGLSEDGTGVMHVFDWSIIAEILERETLQPVEPGEYGELVITPFWRRGGPVVRYRTGDRVRLLPPGSCGCGRQLMSIEAGSISRFDDMYKVKGVNVWTRDVDRLLMDDLKCVDYRAAILLDERRRETIELTVFSESVDAELVARVLKRELKIGFAVTVSPADQAPAPVMKPRRWLDQRSGSPLERLDSSLPESASERSTT